MLLYSGSRDQFIAPLQSVCGIVEKHPTLPILSNVLIEKTGERLMLLTTNVEMQICTSIISSGPETAAVTVAARKLHDILRSLPDDAEVSLVMDECRLQIKAGRSRFNLQTLPAENFPRIAETSDKAAVLKLTQKQFKRQLALVQYAMAQQNVRYYFNGMLLMAHGGELKLVATDGHRLAFASEDLGCTQEERLEERLEVILPRKAVLELSRQLADHDEPMEIALTPTQVRFNFGKIEFTSKLIDGRFPDFERVIPRNNDRVMKVDRAMFQHSLQRAAILIANEKLRGVRLVLSTGSLKILSTNTENEEAQEEIEIDYVGDSVDISFNVDYLIDVLNNVVADAIEVHLADSGSSALIMLPGSERFKYVVMPMRI